MPSIKLRKSARLRFTLYGVLFGLLFPVAIFLSLMAAGVISPSIAIETLRALHSDFPMFYIIDATPLLFGLLAYLFGARKDKLSDPDNGL